MLIYENKNYDTYVRFERIEHLKIISVLSSREGLVIPKKFISHVGHVSYPMKTCNFLTSYTPTQRLNMTLNIVTIAQYPTPLICTPEQLI